VAVGMGFWVVEWGVVTWIGVDFFGWGNF